MLKNLRIENKDRVLGSIKLKEAEENALNKLKGKGRMLLRPSGTEPLYKDLRGIKGSSS